MFEIIFNVLVYVFFAWAMFVMADNSCKEIEPVINDSEYESKMDIWLWTYVIFFTVISAIRYRTGVDTLSYIHYFKNGIDPKYPLEVGFTYIVNYLHSTGLHFSFGMGLFAFLQIYFIVNRLGKYRYILPFMALVMFGGNYYLGYMNAVRQMIAASIGFFACTYIVERKPIKFILWIAVATLFHSSAALFYAFYFLNFIPAWSWDIANRPKLLTIIYFACLILGASPQFQFFAPDISQLTEAMGYQRYSDTAFTLLTNNTGAEARAFGPMQLSYFLTGLFIILYGPKLQEEFEFKIPYFKLWYFLAVAYWCLYFLVCNISHLFIRPIMYLMPFSLVITSLLCYYLIRKNPSKIMGIDAGYLFLIIIWTGIIWDVWKNTGLRWECTSYKTFLFN